MTEIAACPICRSTDCVARPEKLRDSDTLGVRECADCGHVFLSSFAHVDDAYFVTDQFLLNKPFLHGLEQRQRHYAAENAERAERIGPLLLNKRVLDFGCGTGALMHKIGPLCESVEGLERTAAFRRHLIDDGFTIHERLDQARGPYDVILMFHVLEHLADPVATIKGCLDRLSPGGLLYVEVPNINDALLSLYDVDAYRRFHFFSDHLHYFCRASLADTIARAGASALAVIGHSRFGLANHLYWLKTGKAGGHMIWNFLETPSLFREYARALAAADMGDSLIAQVRTESPQTAGGQS